jgi:hypothetical protein
MRLPAILAAMGLLAGCTSVQIDSGGGGTIAGVGLYRITVPETKGSLLAIEQTGVGLGWSDVPEQAAWLGFRESQWVIADPAQCQLLIIIKSAAQAENAAKIINLLEGEQPCIVDHTGTLRP